MINRINLILRAKNITARQFAEEIGIQPSGMSHILGGRNNPSLDFISKVLRRYPEIDANWLLLGKGEMYTAAHGAQIPKIEQSVLPTEQVLEEPMGPSLFDEEPVEVPLSEAENSVHKFQNQQEPVNDGQSYLHGNDVTAPELLADMSCCVERILFIYSDNTYKELRPRQ